MSMTPREALRQNAAGVSSVSLSGWLPTLAVHAAETPKRKHKACILLWMDGGPSQTDTFDPKPDAPADYRGPYKTIDTDVTGLHIAEGYSRVAKLMKHASVIRGMRTEEATEHWRARIYMHTSYRPNFGGLSYPTLGSIVASKRPPSAGLPNFVVTGKTMLNFPHVAGAGYLGPRHNGLLVRDLSKGLENVKPLVEDAEYDDRIDLVNKLAQGFQRHAPVPAVAAQRAAYQGAVELVRSGKSKVFDLAQENTATHERYGKHEFGQGCLLARRLVEADVPFVEVYLGDWDSHEKRRADLVRDSLLPQSDQGIHALLTDLKERGMLDSTLVVWMGEFGRTPKVAADGSRQHFDKAWSTVLFGGGVPGGLVVGKTDPKGNEVVERPVSGPEFIATVLKVLGLDPTSDLHAGSRPVRMAAPGGTPLNEIVRS
jgi:hypothetical protein